MNTAPSALKRLPVLLVLFFALGGCAFFDSKEDATEDWSADRLYTEAKARLNSGYFEGAAEYYEKLQARYPFSAYAQQAQLDMAYAFYKSGKTAEAVAACDRFIRLYPTHPNVDYAYYLRGLAAFVADKGFTQRYLPQDASQRDQGAALQAFRDFSELVRRFPDSRYVKDARQRMLYLRNLLAQHEVNVANYYMRRGAFVAALNRCQFVVENYQRAPAMPEALTIMAKAYQVLEMPELADDAVRVLEMNFPGHPGLTEIKRTVLR